MSENNHGRNTDSSSSSEPPPQPDRDIYVGLFDTFRSGVIDLNEHGEELVVGKEVWITEELVMTRRVTERSAVVRDVIRRVDVGLDTIAGKGGDPL